MSHRDGAGIVGVGRTADSGGLRLPVAAAVVADGEESRVGQRAGGCASTGIPSASHHDRRQLIRKVDDRGHAVRGPPCRARKRSRVRGSTASSPGFE
jgi:hypothetical protein